jgi:hypothetical protein
MINKTAVSKTNNTATFNAIFAQPGDGSSLPPTGKLNFTFYVNGVFVSQDYITSFIDNNDGTCTLTLDTNGLGYSLESTDEITAVGKFI